jgi:uncharacterized membrane protein YcaP (DUF421 family)
MLSLTMPLGEIAVRATIVYFAVIALIRLIPKRNAGHVSPNDMLTLIVIGTLATDAIIGEGSSLADKLVMIGIIVAWSYLLDLLEYRVPALRRLLRDRQTILVDRGKMVRRNMRREMVTEEELMAVLRKEGIDDLASVRSACMEADGEISVIAGDGRRER